MRTPGLISAAGEKKVVVHRGLQGVVLGQIGHQHVADGGGGLPLLLAGDDALVLQAGVAVVVDTEGEGHVVGEGLALESHILDALPGGLGPVSALLQRSPVPSTMYAPI